MPEAGTGSAAKRPRRSMLLVTGANAALLEAALTSEADIVCVDFEDTVTDKSAAHELLRSALRREGRAEIAVRLNPVSTEEGLGDLLMLRSLSTGPAMVVMTMVVDPFEVKLVAKMLWGVALMVIIETPQALEQAAQIALASPAVEALWLGGKDLSYALGCDRVKGLAWARGRVVQAAAVAGLPVFDDIYRPFDDFEGLAAACRAGRELGLHAKVTIDAGQIPVINRQLT